MWDYAIPIQKYHNYYKPRFHVVYSMLSFKLMPYDNHFFSYSSSCLSANGHPFPCDMIQTKPMDTHFSVCK